MFQGYLTFKAGVSLEIVGDISSQGKNGATGASAANGKETNLNKHHMSTTLLI